MNKPKLLQFAALISAVSLASGFIAYRVGAMESLRALITGESSNGLAEGSPVPESAKPMIADTKLMMMESSVESRPIWKFGDGLIPPPPAEQGD